MFSDFFFIKTPQQTQLFINMVQQFNYPGTFWNLIDLDGARCRGAYKFFATHLGSLFRNFDDEISIPIGNITIGRWFPDNPQRMIYDCFLDEWVPYTQLLFESIPPTYTFAERPINIEMELDYYLRGVCAPKHQFIWSVDAIPKDDFSKVAAELNQAYRCRYTFAPYLPWLCNMNQTENGRYVASARDLALIYKVRSARIDNFRDSYHERFYNLNLRHIVNQWNRRYGRSFDGLFYPFNYRPANRPANQ